MEIVVAFAHGDECRKEMIPRSVFVIVTGLPEPMRDRVDAERALIVYSNAQGFA